MIVEFIDKETKKEAELSEDCTEFVINRDGNVYELLKQHYANFFGLLIRNDVVAIIKQIETDNIEITCVNCGPQKIRNLRCGKCDAEIGA